MVEQDPDGWHACADDDMAPEGEPPFICTETNGHEGPHRADGPEEMGFPVFATWERGTGRKSSGWAPAILAMLK